MRERARKRWPKTQRKWKNDRHESNQQRTTQHKIAQKMQVHSDKCIGRQRQSKGERRERKNEEKIDAQANTHIYLLYHTLDINYFWVLERCCRSAWACLVINSWDNFRVDVNEPESIVDNSVEPVTVEGTDKEVKAELMPDTNESHSAECR